MRGLLHAVEAFQREDRLRQLIGAAVQYRTGQRQEFLRHRLRVRERAWLAGRGGMERAGAAVLGGVRSGGPERRGGAVWEPVVLHHVELVGKRVQGGVAEPL